MPVNEKNSKQIDETMISNPDRWYHLYSKLANDKQYDWIMETLDKTLPPVFFEQLPFAEFILELDEKKEPAKYAALIDKLRGHAAFYQEEFQYFERDRAAYYLLLDQDDKVAESLQYYVENPIQGIDQLLQLVQELVYYGKTAMAVKCAEQTCEIVATSTELIGGAEEPLAKIMFMWCLQQVYTRIKQGHDVDWDVLEQDLQRFHFGIDADHFAHIRARLSQIGQWGPGEERSPLYSPSGSASNPGQFGKDNLLEFAKYMLDCKQFDFPLSEEIWVGAIDFLIHRKGRRKSNATWEEWFAFAERELEGHLAEMVGAFLSDHQTDASALLWGMSYVYDFLFDQGVISEKLHIHVAVRLGRLKHKMKHAYRDELWRHAFVDRWPAPDYAAREHMQLDEEEHDLDVVEYDEDDIDSGSYKGMFAPSFNKPSDAGRRPMSSKEKQKKKKTRQDAKKQRKKNRK